MMDGSAPDMSKRELMEEIEKLWGEIDHLKSDIASARMDRERLLAERDDALHDLAELTELWQHPTPPRWTREKPTDPGDYPMRRTEVIRIHENGLHSYPRYLQEDVVEYGISEPEPLEPEGSNSDPTKG